MTNHTDTWNGTAHMRAVGHENADPTASAVLRRRPPHIAISPIGQAADIACDIADVLTRLNDNDIPDLDTAANHLREAARLVRPHVPAATTASQRYRHTV